MLNPTTHLPILDNSDVQAIADAERLLADCVPIIAKAKECGIDVGMYDEACKYYMQKFQQIREHFVPAAVGTINMGHGS